MTNDIGMFRDYRELTWMDFGTKKEPMEDYTEADPGGGAGGELPPPLPMMTCRFLI